VVVVVLLLLLLLLLMMMMTMTALTRGSDRSFRRELFAPVPKNHWHKRMSQT
jgi:hypothetical protein